MEDIKPPYIPPADENKDWRTDYDIYLDSLRSTFDILTEDKDYLTIQEKYNPNVDIVLTLEKSCVNFWATEAGWQHKKKSRSKTLDWKQTLTNAISISKNKVYK